MDGPKIHAQISGGVWLKMGFMRIEWELSLAKIGGSNNRGARREA